MTYYTIDGFENLTPQQVGEMAVRHVLKNGRKSFDGTDCTYDGIGCAASVFLKPEYRHGNASWSSLYDKGLVPQAHILQVRALQDDHDYAHSGDFLADYKRRSRNTFARFGLTIIPELEN